MKSPKIKKLARVWTYPVSVGRPRTPRKRPTAARIMKAAVVSAKGADVGTDIHSNSDEELAAHLEDTGHRGANYHQ